ncbi:conserved hypothetical protein [gamma proteobacterium HdN1]|nr:conserved hypothetical protein [gamma proteobacterium HdN1]
MHPLHNTSLLPRNQVGVLVLLGDHSGFQQVLLCADSLLDLNRICEIQCRDLRALSTEEQQQLALRNGVESLTALPLVGDARLLVDERLTQQERVYLSLPDHSASLAFTQAEFAKLIEGGKIERFTIPASPLCDSRQNVEQDDQTAVEYAVKNFTTLRIHQRLEQTLEMPPLPATAERIINLRLDPNAGINELVTLVERDPSLAAQVVSWAASPYYAVSSGIHSVRDAIVRVLGFDLVINLALGLALGRTLDVPRQGTYGVHAYWTQSVYTAALMEGLAKAIPIRQRPQVGLCYLSGLLHNYGYLVLAHVFPPHFAVICRYLAANPHLNHGCVERHVLDLTREQISSQLMGSWQMPAEIVAALRWQNYPAYQGPHARYAQLLFIATRLLGREGLMPSSPDAIPAGLMDELGLDPQRAEAALQKVRENEQDLQGIARNLAGP